tara:strand:+ start:471 stop:1223 length:753 start_codon:yes stop_codon:yes gene_type:complete
LLKMNKKGILMGYVLIFTILAVSLSIALFYNLESQRMDFKIGEVQSNVIKSYYLSNQEKYFLDASLRKESKKSVNELLIGAGINNPIYKSGYVLWKKGNKECFPNSWTKIKDNLIIELENSFDGNKNFDIFREQDNLLFKLDTALLKNISGEYYDINYSEYYETEYLIKDFNFDEFISKVDKIEEISNLCNDDETCWQNEFSNLNDFELEIEDKLFKFEFITPDLDGEIVVKSAIDYDPDYNFGEKKLKC